MSNCEKGNTNYPKESEKTYELRQWIGLFFGPLVFLVFILQPSPEGLEVAGWRTAATGLLMAIWWISEALPIPATSLLPLVLFPLLEIVSVSEAASPFSNPLIYLFMGGFVIAIAMQTWNLHRRIALGIVSFMGVKSTSIILGFMIASAFLSMWVSNTATTLMMLPIGLSVIELVHEKVSTDSKELYGNFAIVLVLAIAYACNIGGMGTIVGTPSNALLVGFLSETYGYEIGFAHWMLVGVPLVIIGIPVVFLILTRFSFPLKMEMLPSGRQLIKNEMAMLGPMTKQEKKVAAVFAVTAFLWISRGWLNTYIPGLNDSTIAIGGALVCFIIPVEPRKGIFLLNWKQASQLPWGVLILFGGGLSLANAISVTGLAEWIGKSVMGLNSLPFLFLLLSVIVIVIILTEITSNTATTAAFVPILASVALGVNQNPLLFVIPAALAASCAFMLPVATPPNAIVYGSGFFSIPQMAKAGVWLNVIFIFILTIMAYFFLGVVFDLELGILPSWAN